MDDSLGEIRAALADVTQRLYQAHHCAGLAARGIAEAVAVLTDLDRAHHESLVPPQLLRADEELTRGLGLISGGVDSVAAVEARL